jgi:hypothetical protein
MGNPDQIKGMKILISAELSQRGSAMHVIDELRVSWMATLVWQLDQTECT